MDTKTEVTEMIRVTIILLLITLPCIALAQASDPAGTYVGQQLGVRGGQTVALDLISGGKATIAIAQTPGARPMISRGTWRLEGSGFVRVDIAGMAGSGTMYFHRYNNQLVATQDPFELGGFPLHLDRLEPVDGTYTTTRTGPGGFQRLKLQLNQDQTAALTLQQNNSVIDWNGTWQAQPSGDIQLTLDTSEKREKITLTRDGAMLRASQWNRSLWGNTPIVFVRG